MKIFSRTMVLFVCSGLFLLAVPVSADLWQNETIMNIKGNNVEIQAEELLIDSANNLHVLFGIGEDYTRTMMVYKFKDRSGWTEVNFSTGGVSAWLYSFSLDPSDRPHIFYQNWSVTGGWGGRGQHLWYNGDGWVNEDLENRYRAIHVLDSAIDSSGVIHILYSGYGGGPLMYANKSAAGWQEPIQLGGNTSWTAAIALDSLNNPHILSSEINSPYYPNFYYYRDSGGWHKELFSNGDLIKDYNIALDSHNNPHIALSYNYQPASCSYYHRDGSGWHQESIKFSDLYLGGAIPWLAIDSKDQPHIVASTFKPGGTGWIYLLEYMSKDGSGWHPDIIVAGSVISRASIALDNEDNPHVIAWEGGSCGTREYPFKHYTRVAAGNITVVSDPAGAEIFLDGADTLNVTPFTIHDVPAGPHIVLVKKDGYVEPESLAISVLKGETVTADFLLLPLAAQPIPFPGYPDPPTDPDGDGVCEDLNGNGRMDFADVVLYFSQMQWIAANEPIAAFDLNKNGRIDFADIVALFNEI